MQISELILWDWGFQLSDSVLRGKGCLLIVLVKVLRTNLSSSTMQKTNHRVTRGMSPQSGGCGLIVVHAKNPPTPQPSVIDYLTNPSESAA